MNSLLAGGNVLIVVHKGSIDTCTLQLRGKKKRPYKTFHRLVQSVPYCAVGVLEEQSENGNGNRKTASSGDVRSKSNVSWKMVAPAVPPFSDAYNKTYDWKIWL